jgi:hypothetical protein
MTPSAPPGLANLFEEIEETLINEGHVPREIDLQHAGRAYFWIKTEKLWVERHGSPTPLPYFDPRGLSDDRVREKVMVYLVFS